MIYKLMALLCMAVFYGCYFGKMIMQKRRGIKTNQMAKQATKDKGYYIELLLTIATYAIPVVELISIFFASSNLVREIFGLYFAALGDIVFALAIVTMRDSWRAGVATDDMKERHLVVNGIYKYSRNPAFLGFDLLYIGILIMFFNPILLIFTLFSIVMMHLQILNEEKYLESVFKEEYIEYRNNTSRYAGFGRLSFNKVILYCYVLLFIWCCFYFVTCFIYGGPSLSMMWIWPALGIFCAVRIRMLMASLEEKSKIPKAITVIYRCIFTACLIVFVIVEVTITTYMNERPSDNLEYVIVLGAGLRGKVPTNPLRVRIEKAYEYMSENDRTILIASGGQGSDEDMSEAQCIKDKLVERGIDPDRIILEDKSTSTEENLINSMAIIEDADASVGIITNGFHEYRANLIAADVGYKNAASVPAITLFPVGIHYTVREFFGVVQYLVFRS